MENFIFSTMNFIGWKNYHVLMVQQQNTQSPAKRSRNLPQREHIPNEGFILGDRSLGTEFVLGQSFREQYISHVVRWFGCQVFGQDMTRY